jgi:hypothetical protein
VEETSHTTVAPAAAAPQTPDGDSPASAPPGENAAQPSPDAIPGGGEGEETPAGERAPTGSPGFSERGRMRRRARFLRKARELAYRDLGGLVFDLHRYGRRNDVLVLAKLDTIGRIDGELRALEASLAERQAVTVLREAGVAACPRCAAIHGSDDRFCPNCGLAMDLRAERPVAGAAAPAPTPAPAPPLSPTPAPVMSPTAVHATQAPAAPPPRSGAAATPASAPRPTAPTTPAHAPNPLAPASPAPASPAAPTPRTTPPAGPAPTAGDSPAEAKDPRPKVDQPTEIVRPPAKRP